MQAGMAWLCHYIGVTDPMAIAVATGASIALVLYTIVFGGLGWISRMIMGRRD